MPPFCQLPARALTFYSDTINLVCGEVIMRMQANAPAQNVKYYFETQPEAIDVSALGPQKAPCLPQVPAVEEEVRFIPMEPRLFAVLHLKQQVLRIFDVDNITAPAYELRFTEAEQVASACWSKNTLFTLTRDGVVSKWTLLANGRKLRDKYLVLERKECNKIIQVDYDVSPRPLSPISTNSEVPGLQRAQNVRSKMEHLARPVPLVPIPQD